VSSLDAVASNLATTVNGLHPGFFTGTTAATIAVDPAVLASPATTITAGSGAPGDNSIAQAIANLRGTATDPAAGYQALVSQMGGDASSADRASTTAQTLQAAAQDRRQAVNGVSLDEEMTNLVRFQRGYQAASRAFSTMDEMLDTLINRTGKVGL
jgi:flagellar hook-associated protein 1 FlgK